MVRTIYEFYKEMHRYSECRHKAVPKLLSNGDVRVHNIDHKQGGLGEIPAGIDELKQGKVSGKRLVCTIA